MTPKEAHDRLWKLEYTATVNQLYYDKLGAYLRTADYVLRAVSVSLTVLGGVLGIIQSLGGASFLTSKSVGIGVASMAATLLLEMLGTSRLLRYAERLRDRWTDLRGSTEQLYVSLESADADKVAPKNLEQLKDLIDAKTQIDKDEWLPSLDRFHRACQRQVNRQTYAVSEGTYAEVMAKKEAEAA